MFALLKIKPDEKGLWTRIKFKFKPPEPLLERVNVRSAAPFYYLELYQSQCGNNYSELSRLLGVCAKSIVLCDDTYIKENNIIKLFKPTSFFSFVIINSAEELLRKEKFDRNKYTIGLYDKKGLFCSQIERFVTLAGEIRIFTDNKYAYEDVSQYIFDKWGASVVVSENYENMCKCDFLISPSNDFNRFFNNTLIIKNDSGCFDVLKGSGITLPNEYAVLCPSGVDKGIFAAALYETCGVKQLNNLSYDEMNKIYTNVLPFRRKIGL